MYVQIIAAMIGAFLGGAFSAGTGWWLQSKAENTRIARLRHLFLMGIRDDLINSIELYQRLADDWAKSNIIWYTTLHELNDSRVFYNNNRDYVAFIENADLRSKIAKYYRESANHLLSINNAQVRKDAIQREFQLLVRDLLRQSNFSEPNDIIKGKAEALMKEENRELEFLTDKSLPELISTLQRFRADAKSLELEVSAQIKN